MSKGQFKLAIAFRKSLLGGEHWEWTIRTGKSGKGKIIACARSFDHTDEYLAMTMIEQQAQRAGYIVKDWTQKV